MKKWAIFLLLPAVLPLLSMGSFGGRNITAMEPVEAVLLQEKEGMVQIRTDTDSEGIGKTVQAAWQQMNDTASHHVFADTADILLLKGLDDEGVYDLFRPSCKVCRVEEEIDLKEAVKFLKMHEPGITLTMLRAKNREIPLLVKEGSGFCLVE